jgi:cytochrome d ubiquinol oxidase subunit II
VSAADLAYAAIFGALALYAVLGGADFGAGIWDALTRRSMPARDRALLYDAIGPVWEANHVWLVFALVLTMTAFPAAFATAAESLRLPLLAAAGGIVFRGSAFVFRAYGGDVTRAESRWSAAFGAASTLTPLCFGAAAGALAAGGLERGAAPLAAFLRPLPLVAALLAVASCAYLSGVYLVREATAAGDEALVAAWRRRALAAGAAAGALAGAGLYALATSGTPLWRPFVERAGPLVALSAGGAAVAFRALWRRRPTLAAAGAAVAVAAVLAGWAVAQHPWVLPGLVSTADAAPPAVLTAMLWASAAGGLLLAPSFFWLLRLFKSGRAMGRRDARAP